MNHNIKRSTLLTMTLLLHAALWATGSIRPGQLWPDTQGQHINAHGGGVLIYQNKYYWFGEYKSDNTSSALVGVTCYSSSDLTHWRNRGIALSVSTEPGSEIERGCIIERPKVIYNPKTKKFVMWFHLELKDLGYRAARAAVAVSDKVTGPYHFVRSQRANAYCWPVNFSGADIATLDTLDATRYPHWWTPEWRRAIAQGLFLKRDYSGGQMSRDMTLSVDDDGKAYHIYASEDNLTLHIAQLNSDFTAHNGRYVRVAAGGQNEAPALFKHQGKYWMITSGCTGWDPNEARMFSADSLFGPWTQHPNPCVGPNAKLTFGAQGTYVLRDLTGRYIFMADIWRPSLPSDARYVWLPIAFEGGVPVIRWVDEWQP